MSGFIVRFVLRQCREREVLVIHVNCGEVNRVRSSGAYIAMMRGKDKDRPMGVSSLSNEEPLVVM